MKVSICSVQNHRIIPLARVELERRLCRSLAKDSILSCVVGGRNDNASESALVGVPITVTESLRTVSFDLDECASELRPSRRLHACDGCRRMKQKVAGLRDECPADADAARSSAIKVSLQQVRLPIGYLATVLLTVERNLDGDW